ncbi:ribosome maturation factor RimM [Alkalisalibacterium limincola]|jgi:16S rRNA processing protein RimM
MSEERRIKLGKVVGVHGVRGELKIESHTDPRDRLFRYQPWILCHARSERMVEGVRGHDNGRNVLAVFPDVEDRDQAQALIGAEIWVPRSALPPPAPGEYYWVDLEGLPVRTVDGIELGTVSHMLETGANDVIVVHGERERLIPFLKESVVKSVDMDGGGIVVDWDPDF